MKTQSGVLLDDYQEIVNTNQKFSVKDNAEISTTFSQFSGANLYKEQICLQKTLFVYKTRLSSTLLAIKGTKIVPPAIKTATDKTGVKCPNILRLLILTRQQFFLKNCFLKSCTLSSTNIIYF